MTRVKQYVLASGRSVLLGSLSLLLLATNGCVALSIEQHDARRVASLRASVAAGDPHAAFVLAREVARRGARVGQAREAVGWAQAAWRGGVPAAGPLAGRLMESIGQLERAWELWLELLSTPGVSAPYRAYSALRLASLLDRVPLALRHLEALSAQLEAYSDDDRASMFTAELMLGVARRLNDDERVAQALSRLGGVRSYRRTGRLGSLSQRGRIAVDGFDATQLSESRVEAGWKQNLSSAISTPDGTIAFSADGPGIYAALITLDEASYEREIELIGRPSVSIHLNGERLGFHQRMERSSSQRVSVKVPAKSSGPLVLWVVSGEPSPHMMVRIRPRTRPLLGRGADSFVDALVQLALNLKDRDPASIHKSIEALKDHGRLAPVVAPEVAAWFLDDPALPQDVGRANAQGVLEAALAALPDLSDVRFRLAALLLSGGQSEHAEALSVAGLSGLLLEEISQRIAAERGENVKAERLAARQVAKRPSSCRIRMRYLDAAWDRLRVEPQAELESLPACFDLRLKAAALALEGWRLDSTAQRLEELQLQARPGAQRARLQLAWSQLELARDQPDQAMTALSLGLREGVQREPLLELALQAARVGSGSDRVLREALRRTPGISASARRRVLDPSRDLGLPLRSGRDLARRAMHDGLSQGAYQQGAMLHMLLDEMHTSVLPDGMQVHRVHQVVHLLDDDAVEAFGEIALPEGAEVLEAQTWRQEGGALTAVTPEDILEKTSISLPGLEPGVVAEVAWFWIEDPVPALAPHWISPAFFFESHVAAVHEARFLLRSSVDGARRISLTGQVAPPEELEPGLLLFRVMKRPRVIAEVLDPRPDRQLASVRVSSDLDYLALRERYRAELRPLVKLTPAVEALAEEALLNAEAAPLEELRALYDVVLSHVVDGSGGVFDQSAAFTLARRTGDRAVLLVALCRAVGLRCELMLARPSHRGPTAGPGAVIDLDDHTYPLVRARVVGQELWLDPSGRFNPFGLIAPLLQGSEALNLGSESAPVVTVPVKREDEGQRRIQMHVSLHADGRVVVEGQDVLSGLYAASWRSSLDEMEAEARRKALSSVVRQSLPGFDLDMSELTALLEREEPLRFDWKASGRIEPVTGQIILPLALAPEALGRATVQSGSRERPLFINRVRDVEVECLVQVAEGIELTPPEATVTVEYPGVIYRRSTVWDASKRVLRVLKTFRLRPLTVAPETYGAWTKTAQAIDRADRLDLPLRFVSR